LAENASFDVLIDEIRRSGYWVLSQKFYLDRHWLSWQRNLRQNGP